MTRRYDTRIGQQLHQGGNTPGESNSIAKWLRQAFSSAAQAVPPGQREITKGSPLAQSAEWKNQFIPPEQPPFKTPDENIDIDGAKPPDEGGDGTIGVPGYTPPGGGGAGGPVVGPTHPGWNPTDLTPLIQRITRLEYIADNHEYRIQALERRLEQLQLEFPDYSRTFKKIRDDIADLKRRVGLIEDDLGNTIDC